MEGWPRARCGQTSADNCTQPVADGCLTPGRGAALHAALLPVRTLLPAPALTASIEGATLLAGSRTCALTHPAWRPACLRCAAFDSMAKETASVESLLEALEERATTARTIFMLLDSDADGLVAVEQLSSMLTSMLLSQSLNYEGDVEEFVLQITRHRHLVRCAHATSPAITNHDRNHLYFHSKLHLQLGMLRPRHKPLVGF